MAWDCEASGSGIEAVLLGSVYQGPDLIGPMAGLNRSLTANRSRLIHETASGRKESGHPGLAGQPLAENRQSGVEAGSTRPAQ